MADHEPPPAERSGPAHPPWLSRTPEQEEPREGRRRSRRSKQLTADDTLLPPPPQPPAEPPRVDEPPEVLPDGVIKRVRLASPPPSVEHRIAQLRAEQALNPSDDRPENPEAGVPQWRAATPADPAVDVGQAPRHARGEDVDSDAGSSWFDEAAQKYDDEPGDAVDDTDFSLTEDAETAPAAFDERSHDADEVDEPSPNHEREEDGDISPESRDLVHVGREETSESPGADNVADDADGEASPEPPSDAFEFDDIAARADRLLARQQAAIEESSPAEPQPETPAASFEFDDIEARADRLLARRQTPSEEDIVDEAGDTGVDGTGDAFDETVGESFDDASSEPESAPPGVELELDDSTPPTAFDSEPAPEAPAEPEVDEIEARAARLLAQMEARRGQRAPVEPEPPAEPEVVEAPASAAVEDVPDVEEPAAPETPPPADVEPNAEQIESSEDWVGEPAVPPPPGEHDAPADPFAVAEPEPDQHHADGAPERPTRQRSDKRMALPPWQVPSAAMSREFDPTLDATGRQAVRHPVEPKMEEPIAQAPPAPADREPPPPAQDQPPQPTPGFQGPPPGWGPLPPPPPPPGWRNPPPWMTMPLPPPGWLPPPPAPPGYEPPPPMPPRHAEQARHAAPPPPQTEPPRHAQPEGWVRPPSASPPPPNYQQPQAFRVPPSLDEAEVFNRSRHAPQSGWRRTVHRATGGRINPGDSRKNRAMEELLAQIRQPIVGDFRIAVLSIKGGVGKTTTTLGLGSALAMVRTDRVIALDANPDRGTLAERVRDFSTRSTVRDLLRDQNIRRYADVRAHTRMASSRLEVLASEQDPAVAEVFGETDYRHTMDILRHYYNVILTDCGTGIMHSAMAGVLDLAHAIVLVSSPAIDAARSASATLDWLMQHGHAGLVREAHVVLSASRPGSAALKLDKVYEHFEARCRSIHLIPFDEHLAEGADIDFGLLKPATMQAYIELAGAVSEKFSRLRVSYDGR